MASRTKTPEEWIAFLMGLIEHTKDFKPDWEGFARDTGMYKRGKFVQQAFANLRTKYTSGQFAATTSADGASSVPATPTRAKKSTAAAATGSTGKGGRKRKNVDVDDEEFNEDEAGTRAGTKEDSSGLDHTESPSVSPSKNKKVNKKSKKGTKGEGDKEAGSSKEISDSNGVKIQDGDEQPDADGDDEVAKGHKTDPAQVQRDKDQIKAEDVIDGDDDHPSPSNHSATPALTTNKSSEDNDDEEEEKVSAPAPSATPTKAKKGRKAGSGKA